MMTKERHIQHWVDNWERAEYAEKSLFLQQNASRNISKKTF